MNYIRPVDRVAPGRASAPGELELARWETAAFTHCTLSVSGPALAARRGEGDTIYYVLSGALGITVGEDALLAPDGALAFVPAGLSHTCSTEGLADSTHLRIELPSLPLATDERAPLQSIGEPAVAARPYVVSASDVAPLHPGGVPGFSVYPLAGPEQGVGSCLTSLATVEPEEQGLPLHLHPFDQFYFVLEGHLDVQIGLAEFSVGNGTLVILPAGVPHRQRNPGPGEERHLSVLAPTPAPGSRWDIDIELRETVTTA
jgi:mannose-6-phosphate isomerase-like protein (cupin superfamily)